MKTIGLIGGMSWESTISYYQLMNEEVKQRLGGLHSAKLVLYSVDFQEIERCQKEGNWEVAADILGDAAKSLEKAGAELIIICTNTMHKVFHDIQKNVHVPMLHIAEAMVRALKKNDMTKVGLLGTKYTMLEDFYKDIIISNDIEVLIPNETDMEKVNTIIFSELCLGKIKETSKQEYLRIIEKLKSQGAQGIILGCTEIGLLIHQADTSLPVFDTTAIHAKTAIDEALTTES